MSDKQNHHILDRDSVNNVHIMADKYSVQNYWDNHPEVTIPVLILLVCFISIFSYFVWLSVKSLRNKKLKLEAMTSKPSANHLYTGVKASQTIEFVVPTITLKCTEQSFSLTEESDSDYLWQSPYGYGERRKRNSNIQINENEISKSLYEDMPTKTDDEPEINFVLHYSFSRQQLLVTLLSARNLISKRGHHLNPMAKVVLLPEKNSKFVTKVLKNTTDPIFNELFIFQAIRETLDERIVKITVYNTDSFSRKHVIGRAMFPLRMADIHSKISKDVMTEDISCLLINRQPTGELLLSLTYDTNSSTLTLGTLKVRNIFDKEIETIYMKIVLFVKRKRIRSRKTTLRNVEPDIEFNDTFHVNVSKETLNDLIISIAVYGKSSLYINKHLLGRLHVGHSCPSPAGRQQWLEMCTNLDNTVNQWYSIS